MKSSKQINTKSVGLPPGSIIFVGEQKIEKPKIKIVNYNENEFISKEVDDYTEAVSIIKKNSVTWINVIGLNDTELIENFGKSLNINQLLLEDILNTTHRPKIEFSDNLIFIAIKLTYLNDKTQDIYFEHISMVLGKNYVLLFQEGEPDNFDTIKERIQNNKGRITKLGSDYLCYSILDLIIDNYFLVIDNFNTNIEEIEEELINNTTTQTLMDIHELKRRLIFLERIYKPIRMIIRKLETEETKLIKKSTLSFIRDVYDHILQVTDNLESYKETLTVMMDIYISSQGNKLNEVMKILTIIATIFIPLTFIVGVYGMNFEFMPELKWQYGYFVVWGIMFAIGLIMVLFFKKKKWF